MSNISPLALRIYVSGRREGENEVRQFAGSLNLATGAAKGTERALAGTNAEARQMGLAAREARAMSAGLTVTSQSGRQAAQAVREVNREGRGFFETARGIKQADDNMKQFTRDSKEAVVQANQIWGIYKALQSGSPIQLFSNVVPEELQKKIAAGFIAKGIAEFAGLATTIEPAMTKQLRLEALESFTGSSGAAEGIYNQVDQRSTSSVFGLNELTVAAKTLTKDRQFSVRALTASDDLAAANKDEGANPQDVARALGRLRSGDTGEALERFRDFGIGRPDLEAKGLEFDSGGALADKSTEGINKAIDAVISIIEERFGGLSEKLATETLAGSLSNLEDAFNRARTVVGEQFIPVINFGTRTLTTLVTWFANLPEPIIQLIAWGTALGATLSVLGGVIMFGTLLWGKIKLALMVVHYGIMGVNFVLGLFGTSLTALLAPLWGATASIGVMALTALGLAAAVAALVYVSKMYYDELQHGTEVVQDARDAEAVKNDERSADAVRGAVKESEGLSDKERYAVLKAAYKKAVELGDTALADEIEERRLPLAKKLRAAGVDTGNALKEAESAAGKDLVSRINSQQANNKAARLSAKEYLPKKSETPEDPEAALKAYQAKQANMFTGAQGREAMAATPAGVSSPMLVGAATAQVNSQQSIDVQRAQSTVDSLQREIEALQDSKRTANKEQKAVIAAQLVEKQRQLRAARQELAATKKLSSAAERDAKRVERDGEKRAGYQADVETVRNELAFNDRIDELQLQLEKARDESNAAKVEALVTEIEMEKAKQNLAQARGEAAKVALTDEAKAASMEQIAKMRYDNASKRAKTAGKRAGMNVGDGAKKKGLSNAEIRAIFNATGATMVGAGAGFAALDPSGTAGAGDRFRQEGLMPSLWNANGGSGLNAGIPSIGDFTGAESRNAMNRERTARVKSISQKPDGGYKVKFEDIELPYQGVANVEVD